jgi:hypothetical protein
LLYASTRFLEAHLLLLGDDNTPGVLGTAVHDVTQPALDLAGDLSRRTLSTHGDVDVLATVVDLGDGADEVLKRMLAIDW